MPVALIGRLAIDTRAQGRRLGEGLLTEAMIASMTSSKLLARGRARGFRRDYGCPSKRSFILASAKLLGLRPGLGSRGTSFPSRSSSASTCLL